MIICTTPEYEWSNMTVFAGEIVFNHCCCILDPVFVKTEQSVVFCEEALLTKSLCQHCYPTLGHLSTDALK